VVQQSLGGHALPVDGATLRVASRLGLVEADPADAEAARTSLEHQVPKAKGTLFIDGVSNLAAEYCLVEAPLCGRCPLTSSCPKLIQEHEPAGVLALAGKGR
jgi:endonuclease-3